MLAGTGRSANRQCRLDRCSNERFRRGPLGIRLARNEHHRPYLWDGVWCLYGRCIRQAGRRLAARECFSLARRRKRLRHLRDKLRSPASVVSPAHDLQLRHPQHHRRPASADRSLQHWSLVGLHVDVAIDRTVLRLTKPQLRTLEVLGILCGTELDAKFVDEHNALDPWTDDGTIMIALRPRLPRQSLQGTGLDSASC